MLGLWAKPRQYKYKLGCTTDTADVLWTGKHAKRPTPGSGNVYVDVISKIEQLSFKSMRPIHQLTLEHERLCVARMLYITRELSEPKYCLSIVTDGVFLQLGPRQLKQTADFYKHLRYCDMANLHEHVEAKHTLRHYTSAHPVPKETPFESE